MNQAHIGIALPGQDAERGGALGRFNGFFRPKRGLKLVVASAHREGHRLNGAIGHRIFASAALAAVCTAASSSCASRFKPGKAFVADDARKSLRTFVEATVEAVLGKGVVQELLSHLGPDWGVCVVAPPPGDPGWMPHLLGAIKRLVRNMQ